MTDENPTSAAVRDAAVTRANELQQVNAELRAMLCRLADAADEVGVEHFDTDIMSVQVGHMQSVTLQARALIARTK